MAVPGDAASTADFHCATSGPRSSAPTIVVQPRARTVRSSHAPSTVRNAHLLLAAESLAACAQPLHRNASCSALASNLRHALVRQQRPTPHPRRSRARLTLGQAERMSVSEKLGFAILLTSSC